MNTIPLGALSAIALAAVFTAPTARAAEVTYDMLQQAAGACQPAREYPNVRVRQREIDNIGTTNAYIVCALPAYYLGGSLKRIFVRFLNSNGVGKSVSCTLQNGWDPDAANVNDTRQVDMIANDAGAMEWSASEFDMVRFDSPGIQCILPPNVSLRYVYGEYTAYDVDTQ